MKIVIGLGNPGIQYKNNRHNVGFMVMDELKKTQKAAFKGIFSLIASIALAKIGKENVILVKPHTFMNNSGLCVKRVLNRYKCSKENLLVVYDDADLPLGAIRCRKKGSSGGHQGMDSIIKHLGSDTIARLRIGIGKSENIDLSDYVLCDFSSKEKLILDEAITKATSACIDWVNFGSDYVMRNYNKSGGEK